MGAGVLVYIMGFHHWITWFFDEVIKQAVQTKMCLCCGCEIMNWLYFQIMRDPDSGNSRGFGFISYDSFESSDASIEVSVPRLIVVGPFSTLSKAAERRV